MRTGIRKQIQQDRNTHNSTHTFCRSTYTFTQNQCAMNIPSSRINVLLYVLFVVLLSMFRMKFLITSTKCMRKNCLYTHISIRSTQKTIVTQSKGSFWQVRARCEQHNIHSPSRLREGKSVCVVKSTLRTLTQYFRFFFSRFNRLFLATDFFESTMTTCIKYRIDPAYFLWSLTHECTNTRTHPSAVRAICVIASNADERIHGFAQTILLSQSSKTRKR